MHVHCPSGAIFKEKQGVGRGVRREVELLVTMLFVNWNVKYGFANAPE